MKTSKHKPFARPELVSYGSVSRITMGANGSCIDAGGQRSDQNCNGTNSGQENASGNNGSGSG